MPRVERWKAFRKFVEADYNREALYDGIRFMAAAGVVSIVVGYLLDSVLFQYSGVIFFIIAAALVPFFLRCIRGRYYERSA